MVLTKKDIMFEVDGTGKLKPVEIPLVIDESIPEEAKLKGQTIVAIPILRAELATLIKSLKEYVDGDLDLDGNVIKKYCIEPSFNDTELMQIKGIYANVLSTTILNLSGLKPIVKSKDKPKEESKDRPKEKLEVEPDKADDTKK